MNPLLIWRYGKLIGVFVLVVGVVWYYKDAEQAKRDRDRVEENATQERKFDSVKYSEIILTKDEFIEEMEYNNKTLTERLDREGINIRRIEKLIQTQSLYRDTVNRSYILNTLLSAIKQNKPAKERVIDSTDCHVVRAVIHFDGDDLKLDVNSIELTNTQEIVVHREKVGWKIWKWLQKRKVSVSVFDNCNEKSTTRMVKVQK